VKVALYLRVSTAEQNPESQELDVRQFVTGRGWDVTGTYQDVGVSGARERRAALDQLLRDAWQGKFEAVVAWDLSRIARNTLHALQLLRQFQDGGVRLIFVRQLFDTAGPMGQAVYTMLALFAEFERSLLIERVRAGMARARAEGRRIGRPPRPVDIGELRRLRAQGFSLRKVSQMTGIPTSTVAKRLKSAEPSLQPGANGHEHDPAP
jgi:DNA invertase Pin-like site-specific DNA recombinase